MLNPIKEIVKWQIESGNSDLEYSDFSQSAYQIEEALEGFNLPSNSMSLSSTNPRQMSKDIMTWVTNDPDFEPSSDVSRFDKACDAMIYAIGAMTELGLGAQEITMGLLAVNNANKQKLGAKRDNKGKLLKPVDFIGPEQELQSILDKSRK